MFSIYYMYRYINYVQYSCETFFWISICDMLIRDYLTIYAVVVRRETFIYSMLIHYVVVLKDYIAFLTLDLNRINVFH